MSVDYFDVESRFQVPERRRQGGLRTLPPTRQPTRAPNDRPDKTKATLPPTTHRPTQRPTEQPSIPPTVSPSAPPSEAPTSIPTSPPTVLPTDSPTLAPVFPTLAPVFPTISPTSTPTISPTSAPTPPVTVSAGGPGGSSPFVSSSFIFGMVVVALIGFVCHQWRKCMRTLDDKRDIRKVTAATLSDESVESVPLTGSGHPALTTVNVHHVSSGDGNHQLLPPGVCGETPRGSHGQPIALPGTPLPSAPPLLGNGNRSSRIHSGLSPPSCTPPSVSDVASLALNQVHALSETLKNTGQGSANNGFCYVGWEKLKKTSVLKWSDHAGGDQDWTVCLVEFSEDAQKGVAPRTSKFALKRLASKPHLRELEQIGFIPDLLLLTIPMHVNVVSYFGITSWGSSGSQQNVGVLMPYYTWGSLDQHLHGTRRSDIPFDDVQKTELLRDAAAGVAHLHNHDILHRDIAARNFLLFKRDGGGFSVQLNDFGMARKLAGEEIYIEENEYLPTKWCPREVLTGKQFSKASDAYSFGCVMFEMMIERIPFDGLTPRDAETEIVAGNHPELPKRFKSGEPGCDSQDSDVDDLLPLLGQEMLRCWALDEHTRPSLADLREGLSQICKNCGASDADYQLPNDFDENEI